MSHQLTDTVLMGLETTRGTVASSFDFHCPILRPGLVPNRRAHTAKVESSATFPYVTKNVPVGVTTTLSLTPDINKGTFRDLLLLATKWTLPSFPAFSIARTSVGVEHERFLGCGVTRFEYGYSRSSEPGDDAILRGSMDIECMSRSTTSGLSAGTQSAAGWFAMQHSTFTINSVAALEVLSYRRTIEIARSLGPPGTTGARVYSVDGIINHTAEIVARFSSAAWRTLMYAQTEHAASFVHSTGALNETVTESLGACQIGENSEASEGDVVTERIQIMTSYTGAAASMVPTFGSSIPASQLGL